MSKPIVAVVGRSNVGKSTLFNRIIGQRRSIVEDTPGVTRDRIYADAEWQGKHFLLIDTGGIEPDSEDLILSQMRDQAEIAIATADVILFITDGRDGLTASDREVGHMLKRTGKPVLLVVNKVDTTRLPDDFYDFYELGLGDPIAVSAANMLGLGDLLDEVTKRFADIETIIGEDDRTHIAIIGKPNVGKSSLLNALIGENRAIVSPLAGTTRDSVDTAFRWNGKDYVLIDTAGIRRKSRVTGDIERFSVIRAISAIERSDVCLLMIDAQEGVTEQDKKIAGLAHEAGKGTLILVNKWDLIEKDTHTIDTYRKNIQKELVFMNYAPILFISVIERQRLHKIMEWAERIAQQRQLRVPTGRLNDLIADAVMMNPPPSDKGKALKIYYATQAGIKPPLYTFKINYRELLHFSYSRYLENKIREGYGFVGTPIKFVFREKGESDDV